MCGQFSRRSLLRTAALAGVTTPGVAGSATLETAAFPFEASHENADLEWLDRELRNYAKTQEAPAEQASDPTFLERWQRRSATNGSNYAERVVRPLAQTAGRGGSPRRRRPPPRRRRVGRPPQ